METLGRPGHEGQRAITLQHRFRCVTRHGDLEEVIHDPERIDAGLVRLTRQGCKLGADRGVAARVHKSRNGDTELHCVPPVIKSTVVDMSYDTGSQSHCQRTLTRAVRNASRKTSGDD